MTTVQGTNAKLSIQNDEGKWVEITGVTGVNLNRREEMIGYSRIALYGGSLIDSCVSFFEDAKVRTKSFAQAMRELKDTYPNKGENEIRNMAMGSKRIRVSRHNPHQSTKEKQRRINQIAKGMLKFKAA